MTRGELFVHAVWATWRRRPFIDPAIEAGLHQPMSSKAMQLRCPVLAIGGTSDHVHVVARVHATIAISRLVGEIKGYSSYVIGHSVGKPFRWQEGYYAATITADVLGAVKHYVLHQREHHRLGRI